MPKYLIRANYKAEGVKALLKDGGTARKNAAEKLVQSAGGSLEAFYFAFGPDDVIAIVDLPDATAAAACALNISASGAATAATTVLLRPEEIDKAAGITVDYSPPKA